jgi:hypothetical protein
VDQVIAEHDQATVGSNSTWLSTRELDTPNVYAQRQLIAFETSLQHPLNMWKYGYLLGLLKLSTNSKLYQWPYFGLQI